MTPRREARIIRVPFGLGANNFEGLELGPRIIEELVRIRIREFQLDATPAYTQTPLEFPLSEASELVEAASSHADLGSRFSTAIHIEAVRQTCLELRDRVRSLLQENEEHRVLPIVLGGDHSIAIGTCAGVLSAVPAEETGLLWIDSHADYNTGYVSDLGHAAEYDSWGGFVPGAGPDKRRGTSPTGHIHGMSMAVATGSGDPSLLELYDGGLFVEPRNVVVIGVREVDREERDWLARDGVKCFSGRAVEFRGIPSIAHRALTYLADRGVKRLCISFDIDVLDAPLVPGTGTPVPGGFSFRQADLLLRLLRQWLPEAGITLQSFELVEVNPLRDRDSRTAGLASRLVCAILGEEILVGEEFAFERFS